MFYTHRLFTLYLTQFVKIMDSWRTITEDCECFIIFVLVTGGYIKISSVVLNTKNINQLLSVIDYHWRVFVHSVEIQIMHDYAVAGRKITIFFIVTFYSLLCLFMAIPPLPKLLNIIKPLNESRPNIYMFDVDYSFDREEYYFTVLLHSYITAVIGISMLLSVDSLYIVLTQHGCSLFAAVGQRLENLNSAISSWKDNELEKTHKGGLANCVQYDRDEKIYRELIVILWKHQLCLEYVNLLNFSFGHFSFMYIFLNMMAISLLLMQILALMDRKGQMIRFVAMLIGAFGHLFILNFPGQRIMDHSSDIFDKAYNVLWYKLSRKSTQLLSILLYRTLSPCTLTAGNMYVLSLINYASMAQTSFSFFTTLSSLQ
ncbi:odorant receptor Or2-like isoform X2 [Linepithema humile]|uniref:odorant receptor Or2-like isoform X2 n=1 Tax=Linepithema humile TaxID=83485 RepID=UPI00351DFCD4